MRHQKTFGIGSLCAGILLPWCVASAQPTAPGTPAVEAQPAPFPDTLGRTTPRGTVLGFLRAARAGEDEIAAEYLNTRLEGKAAALLAHQLSVLLDRRLPAGIMELSDHPEGLSPVSTKPDRNLIGTIKSADGDKDVVVERVDRGKEGQLWLFSRDTLKDVPSLYDEDPEGVSIESVLPQMLTETRIAHIPLFEWLAVCPGLPLLYLLTVVLNRLLGLVVVYVRRLTSPTTETGDKPWKPEILSVPVRLLIMALVIRWAPSALTLPLLAREFWSSTAGTIAIVSVVWMLIYLNGVGEGLLLDRVERGAHRDATASILRLGRRAIDTVLLVAGVLFALRYFGVDLTAALAGVGVGSIAVALAAQKTLENIIGGISIVFDSAVRVGEMVKVGDEVGFVEKIGLRSTRIRTLDRTLISVPNGHLATVSVETVSVRDKFWFHHTLNLHRETSIQSMRLILAETDSFLRKDSCIESSSIRVRFLGFGESSLDVEVFAYAIASDWGSFLEIQQGLLLEIMGIIQAIGSRLSYPSQTLYISNSDGAVDELPGSDSRSQGGESDVVVPKAGFASTN